MDWSERALRERFGLVVDDHSPALRRVIVSLEVGISDLIHRRYPLFHTTCFFTVLRNPAEWVLSAANHMRSKSRYADGIYGRVGYFDRDNIQAFMVGYGARTRPAVVVCLTTIGDVAALLSPLIGTNASLEHLNHRPHNTTATADVEAHVRQRYARDAELWDTVSEQKILCW
mmetsp:Transcript_19589/g.61588  ORF Transcript_19589/g.61588 Transcript_19589/m.61588 type:complete len:172 (+) Transcript_19589:354-869(+)